MKTNSSKNSFWKDIFDMEWEQWRVYIIFTFLAAAAGTLLGAYLESWLRYINLF